MQLVIGSTLGTENMPILFGAGHVNCKIVVTDSIGMSMNGAPIMRIRFFNKSHLTNDEVGVSTFFWTVFFLKYFN